MRRAFLLAWIALAALPLAWLVWRSGAAAAPAQLIAALGDAAGSAPLLASLAQGALAAGIALLLAWPAALAFARWRFTGRGLGRRVLWLARLCPGALLALPLAALSADAAAVPPVAKVALAHLVFNVPIAVWIATMALSQVPQAQVLEARQDGLGVLGRARYVWGPAWRAALGLAFLACFAASFTEAALTRAIAGDGALAVSLPARGPALADRALAAVVALAPAAVWTALLGGWWATRRSRAD